MLKVIASGTLFASALIFLQGPVMAGCYPNSAASDYEEYLKGGASKRDALRISLDENYDNTYDCKVKINGSFMKKFGWKPF